MSYYIIDLSWVKSVNEEAENQTYICSICRDGPDSVLYEITDPEKLKFVGTDKLYGCHMCGWTWLSSDPDQIYDQILLLIFAIRYLLVVLLRNFPVCDAQLVCCSLFYNFFVSILPVSEWNRQLGVQPLRIGLHPSPPSPYSSWKYQCSFSR